MRFKRICTLIVLTLGLTGCLAIIDDYVIVCEASSDCRDGERCVPVPSGDYKICEEIKSDLVNLCPKGYLYDSDPEECVSDLEYELDESR